MIALKKENDIKDFQLFSGDILIKGEHATMAKFLCKTSEKKNAMDKRKPADVFRNIFDVYIVAAVIGLECGLREAEDKKSKDETRIFADKVIKEKNNLDFVYELAMLVDNSQGLDADTKIARAFKKENIKENFELFNSYVRGGIRWLYENFTNSATTHEDYLEKIYEIVDEFREIHNI